MSLVGVLILVLIIGVCMQFPPLNKMDATMKQFAIAIIGLIIILCVLQGFGVFSGANFKLW